MITEEDIEIKEIRFEDMPSDFPGRENYRGCTLYTAAVPIDINRVVSNHAFSHGERVDLHRHAVKSLTAAVSKLLYGELVEPFAKLANIAANNRDVDYMYTQRLIRQIDAIINLETINPEFRQ